MTPANHEHLCADCRHHFATCSAKQIVWGIDRDPAATGEDADQVLECDTFRRAGAASGERFRLLRTPDPDPEQAAEINRIVAAMAERNAALRQELASLGGSARDAALVFRQLLGEAEAPTP
jgi:hypothetical protein